MLGNDEKGEEHRVAFSSRITGGYVRGSGRETKRDGPIEKEDHRDGKGRTTWGKERMESRGVRGSVFSRGRGVTLKPPYKMSLSFSFSSKTARRGIKDRQTPSVGAHRAVGVCARFYTLEKNRVAAASWVLHGKWLKTLSFAAVQRGYEE